MLVFKILKTVALVFIFSFILQLSPIVFANDCQPDTPPISTVPGNRIIPPNWRDPYKPNIYSDSDEIARSNYVNVWVYSEGRACPTYSWSVSGTGFHFDSASGPTTATTNADLETLQLWADGTACGPATITVTDICGGNDEEYVRCAAGKWVLQFQVRACPTWECPTMGCATCTSPATYTAGNVQWTFTFSGNYWHADEDCPPIWHEGNSCPGTVPPTDTPPCGTPTECASGTPCGADRTCFTTNAYLYHWECK